MFIEVDSQRNITKLEVAQTSETLVSHRVVSNSRLKRTISKPHADAQPVSWISDFLELLLELQAIAKPAY
jgi:hypothetical protein